MKSQKGITLVSVAIYIVLVMVVLGILATVTLNFQKGIKEINGEGTKIAEVNKFNMYFLQEIKKKGNDIVLCTNNEISFLTGDKYVFDSNNGTINLVELDNDGTINKTIELANNIETCTFSKTSKEGKVFVKVSIKPKNADEIIKEYVSNNEESTFIYEDEEEYIYNSNTSDQTEKDI